MIFWFNSKLFSSFKPSPYCPCSSSWSICSKSSPLSLYSSGFCSKSCSLYCPKSWFWNCSKFCSSPFSSNCPWFWNCIWSCPSWNWYSCSSWNWSCPSWNCSGFWYWSKSSIFWFWYCSYCSKLFGSSFSEPNEFIFSPSLYSSISLWYKFGSNCSSI